MQLAGAAAHAATAAPASFCSGLSTTAPLGSWDLAVGATRNASTTLALPPNRSVVIEAVESGLDVTLEVTAGPGVVLSADNPVRRTGIQRLTMNSGPRGLVTVTARAKAHSGVGSRVAIRVLDEGAASLSAACRAVIASVTAADAAYARAQQVSSGQAGAASGSAADLYTRARHNYESALAQLQPDAELPLRAELTHAIAALLYQDAQQWRASAQWAQRAAVLYERDGNAYARARSQALQAAAWMELGTSPGAGSAAEVTRHDSEQLLQRAENQLDALARFHEARGERFDAALQRNNLGLALYYGGAYVAALRAYAKARPLYESLDYAYGRAQVTQNTALVEWDLGRVTAAIADYESALQLITAEESPSLYADILNNGGLAKRTAGELDAALSQHTQALELSTRIQSRWRKALSLFGIGMVYGAAGDQAQATVFLRESLSEWAQVDQPRGQVATLRALALIEAQQGHDAESVRLDREALRLVTDAAVRIRLLVQIADSESRLGQVAAAHEDLSLAAQISASADPVSRGAVNLEQGVLEFRAGHLDSARRLIAAAQARDRALGLEAPDFDALLAASRVEIAAGRPDTALRDLNEGLSLSETLRIQSLDPELRATSMQPLRPAFDLEVALWAQKYQRALRAGEHAAATHAAIAGLEVAERARARAMQDIALADYSQAPDTALATLLKHKAELIHDIAAHEYRLEEAGPPSVNATVQTDISHLREQLALNDSKLAALAGPSQRTDVEGLPPRLDRIPADTALISYWLGETQSYAWIATRSAIQLVDLGPVAALRDAARQAHEVFSDLTATSPEGRAGADERLSQIALRPVLALLPAGVTRLVVIPDGPLHYVSFAALPIQANGRDSFLVRQYQLAYGSSVGALLKGARPAGVTQDRMLLVADPVYNRNDSRLGGSIGTQQLAWVSEPLRLRSGLVPAALERLPDTAAEAAAITSVAPPTVIDRLEGLAATRDAVLGRPLERYRYIHLAVHATTDATIPQLSSLVFSAVNSTGQPIESRVWAGDLMTRRFNADTVVLSACDTALGTAIGGEGLLGLRYVVLARGARSVVASLWAVPDLSTERLMQVFYRQLLQVHQRPELALALAMRQSIHDGPQDPAFWAAFTTTLESVN
jgi:CHAT domain-containing protein/tetratricopeptide (TPR) repeat protein